MYKRQDTDSLLYSIQTDDVYLDMKEDLYLFDTSDYPMDHPCHCDDNKKVVGKFKDETNGDVYKRQVFVLTDTLLVLTLIMTSRREAKRLDVQLIPFDTSKLEDDGLTAQIVNL